LQNVSVGQNAENPSNKIKIQSSYAHITGVFGRKRKKFKSPDILLSYAENTFAA
jgi:hypothetical protein